MILDASVKAGNAADAQGSLEAIERAEQLAQRAADPNASDSPEIKAVLGDCAYGTAENRRAFKDAGRDLKAKQPRLNNGGRYTKNDFPKNAETDERVCPAGHSAVPKKRRRKWRGETVEINVYRWDPKTCSGCPLRDRCLRPPRDPDDTRPRGRSVSDHPEEALLAEARAQGQDPKFRTELRERTTVEHRLARLMQLGARQARYFGRAKTELQWLLTATIANLTVAAGVFALALMSALQSLYAVIRSVENSHRGCAAGRRNSPLTVPARSLA